MLLRKISGGLPYSLNLKHSTSIWRTYCATAATQTCSIVSNGFPMQLNLLGPPELYQSASTTAKNHEFSSSASDVTNGDSSMDERLSSYSRNSEPVMGLTENNSPTYLSSSNPCLDFFFHVVPDTPAEKVTQNLKLAWDHDSITALKLVFNLVGVRGTGKGDREGFYASALWLQENHPKTLAGNVSSVANFGYFKNLLEILFRLSQGPSARSNKKHREIVKKNGRVIYVCEEELGSKLKRKSRAEKRLEVAIKGKEKYENDPTYRFLHDRVSELFAENLQSDLEKIRSGKYNNLSLASKWCPSLYSIYDNSTLICEAIARRLFPKDKFPEYEAIEDAHYAYRVRDRLRKEVLVPLRRANKLPEVYMSAREWNSVVYTRVASIAMKNYAKLFHKHDEERFSKYIECVKDGKKKIAAGALLPHQIIKNVKEDDEATRNVAEQQWKRIVEDLSAVGKLKNCLAICDVSGSMYGEPLEVSVALGMIVSELSEDPWKGKLITFSRTPQLQIIQGEDLQSKISFIEQMDWNMNTDFQRVFDKILEVAVEGNLTEDQMIKRLFVFSDMEFDKASANNWETDYQAIMRKYNEKGFSSVPEIVFWNLRDSKATPVLSNQKGVALVSGFSKNLLKVFLEEGGVLDPVKTMEAALSGKEYKELVVLD